MLKKFSILVTLAIAFLILPAICYGDKNRHDKASKILFPESAQWVMISNAPPLSDSDVAEKREELEAAYKSWRGNRFFLEGTDCSFIGRVFDKDYLVK